MVGLVKCHVLGVDMVAASKALAGRAERARNKVSAKCFKNPKTLTLLLEAQNLQNRLAPEGSRSQNPFWRRKSTESSKLLKIFGLSES